MPQECGRRESATPTSLDWSAAYMEPHLPVDAADVLAELACHTQVVQRLRMPCVPATTCRTLNQQQKA